MIFMNHNNPSENKKINYQSVESGNHGSLVVKILCIFAAFFLWIYVMMVESPDYEETFTGITVEIINEDALNENGLSLYAGIGQTIDVTVFGKKRAILNMDESDIKAFADVSALTSGSGRSFCEVTVEVPEGCTLVGLSQETIQVNIDEQEKISVELSERRDNTNLPEGCTTGTIEFPVDNITVEGPKSILSRISKAILPLDLTDVTKSTTITAQVYFVDSFGTVVSSQYLNYYPQEITVEIPIIKTVEVPVELVFRNGYISTENADISVYPSTVMISGDPSVIDAGYLLEPIEIDEKTDLDDNNKYKRTVHLDEADNVTCIPGTVDVSVSMKDSINTREITVPGKNIIDTGGKIGVYYTWEKNPITVKIMGELDDIRRISAEDITLQLDMSPYTDTNTGTIRVRAGVIIDSPYADEVIEIGVYSVNVTFLN